MSEMRHRAASKVPIQQPDWARVACRGLRWTERQKQSSFRCQSTAARMDGRLVDCEVSTRTEGAPWERWPLGPLLFDVFFPEKGNTRPVTIKEKRKLTAKSNQIRYGLGWQEWTEKEAKLKTVKWL